MAAQYQSSGMESHGLASKTEKVDVLVVKSQNEKKMRRKGGLEKYFQTFHVC